MDEEKIKEICRRIEERIEQKNVCVFKGMKEPLFLISENYFGVWLEHVFDSVLYSELYPEKGREIAKNTIKLFISLQSEEGQYPCYVWDGNRSRLPEKNNVGWAQIQECVSFGKLCLRYLNANRDDDLAEKCRLSLEKWIAWQKKYRMTTKRGLIECFVGFDTGHDNSSRLKGMRFPENRVGLRGEINAGKKLRFDRVAPLLMTDMNAVFYGDLTALADLCGKLGKKEEKEMWVKEAKTVKDLLNKSCYDEEDAFYYDVDKKGRKRKYLSSAILHFFQEGVLDINKDKKKTEEIIKRHVLNEKEFWTPFPFPSMAISDPSTKTHKKKNDWGYFTQGNTALRTILWMDAYGLGAEQDEVCKRWLKGWTDCFLSMPVGQELDPVTGKPSPSAPWYSSGMLFYLWSAKRLGITGKKQ